MTPEQQRIAIVEACGWIAIQPCPSITDLVGLHGEKKSYVRIPDYLNDLNAMHEAEKELRKDQFHYTAFPHELFKVVSGMKWKGDMGYFFFHIVNATAAQRAEAFLRTIGKWKE